MTVMSRLATKGVLEREKRGRAYVYRAAAEQSEVAGSMLSSCLAPPEIPDAGGFSFETWRPYALPFDGPPRGLWIARRD